MKVEKFDIVGMTCSACVAHVEKSVRKLPGIKDVNVNLLTNSMVVNFEQENIDSTKIIETVEDAGYEAFLKAANEEKTTNKEKAKIDHVAIEQKEMEKRVIYSFAFLIPIFYITMGPMIGLPLPYFFEGEKHALVFAFTQFLLAIPIFFINRKFFVNGFKSLWNFSPTMDTLVALGSSAALFYGIFAIYKIAFAFGSADFDVVMKYAHDLFFESGATILTLITLGKYFEARSKRRTSDALSKLIESAPQTAFVIRNGIEEEILVEDVRMGDIVSVRSGQKIPVDGVVLEGMGIVDESALTGESMPVTKQIGDSVLSASISNGGYFTFRATKVGKDTTISQIIQLLEEATSSKAPISRLADKISSYFVPIVISIAIVSFITWLILGYSFEFSLSIGIAVLIISCPCALGLATPVAIMVGSGKGAQFGVLYKSAESLEMGDRIKTVLLDKTGTLTEGKPEVTDILSLDDEIDDKELLKITASLEDKSEHPLAHAIISKANEMNVEKYVVQDFENVIGRGISGKIENKTYYIGNIPYIESRLNDIKSAVEKIEDFSRAGRTPLIVANEEKIIGIIAVADVVKPSSKTAIDYFKSMNLYTVMVTGDNKQIAMAIQKQLGLDEVVAEVLPQDKDNIVLQFQQDGSIVAMIGDGINDAPALARADLGFAIGAGTDIAIEAADVVLMKSDLLDVVTGLRLSKTVIKNIKQNLFWAFFYNILGIPIAAGLFYSLLGWTLNPMIAALAMSLSSVTVVANALRLGRFKATTLTK